MAVRAELRRCSPELLEQYPNICRDGIRQYELDPCTKHQFNDCCRGDHYAVTGHYHFTIDSFTFVAVAE